MSRSGELRTAKKDKKDEFYTTLEDIEAEMIHYRDQFRGKIILCNCDDPYESNFFKYFATNFNFLGIKKLIATCYDGSPFAYTQLSLFDDPDETENRANRKAYKIEITEVPDSNGDGAIDLSDVAYLLKSNKNTLSLLKGNGDFRSEECIELLKEADIVATNPPFSLFREYVSQLMEYHKKFLIIGNVNAITYKEIFPLIKENKLWLGASIHSGDRKFYVPDDYPMNASNCGTDEQGRRYIRVKGVRWFTNLDYKQRHEELTLYKNYYGHENEYPKYDNYDAINVDATSDIPCDYFDNIGVPITFLDKYNPDQFEVVKFRKGDDGNDLTYTRERESATLLQNHHQTQDVMESWECQLPSSISSAQTNLKLSVSRPETSEDSQEFQVQQARTGRTSEINLDMEESSYGESCNGIMGVPITFLDKYNPDQFEILGITSGREEFGREAWPTKKYINPKQHNPDGTISQGSKANTRACLKLGSIPNDIYYTADNAGYPLRICYARILVRRRKHED